MGKETEEGNGEELEKGLKKLESERISFTGLPLFINDLFYSSTLASPEILRHDYCSAKFRIA